MPETKLSAVVLRHRSIQENVTTSAVTVERRPANAVDEYHPVNPRPILAATPKPPAVIAPKPVKTVVATTTGKADAAPAPSLRQLAINLTVAELGLPAGYRMENRFFDLLQLLHDTIMRCEGDHLERRLASYLPGYNKRTREEKDALVEQLEDLHAELQKSCDELGLKKDQAWEYMFDKIEDKTAFHLMRNTQSISIEEFLQDTVESFPTTAEELEKLLNKF